LSYLHTKKHKSSSYVLFWKDGMLDHIFRGMIKSHTESEDLFVKEDMTNKMFMDSKIGFGLDLVAQV